MMAGKFPTCLIAAVAGFFVMLLTGWRLGAGPPAAAPGDDPMGGRKQIQPVGEIPTPSSQTSAIRSARGSQARLRETIKLAQSLSPTELRDWLEENRFDIRGGFELMLFRCVAERRFARLEPEMYAEWDHRRGGDSMLREWAERDPQRLLAFARTHPRDPRLSSVLPELAKHHPEAAIQYLQESALGGYQDPSHIEDWWALREIHHRTPAALESALETLPSPWRRRVEDIKLADAIATSPGPTMEALYERADGWEAFRRAHSGSEDPGELLLEEITALPASWKAALAAAPRYVIRRQSAQRWAEADLEGAGFTPEQAEAIREAVKQ